MDASETGPVSSNREAASYRPALLLSRRDIAGIMSLEDYLSAVEGGFRAYRNGDADVPMPMHIPAPHGGFHAKSARLVLDRTYVALKLNGNFPGNPERNGLPTIQGVVVLCDGNDGSVLAVMDSIEVTLRRTAAATALAARYLAPANARTLAICGCGAQGRAQLEALAAVLPLQRVFAWDLDAGKAKRFARDMAQGLRLEVDPVPDIADAARSSNVIVTATTARAPFLDEDMVRAGTFVAAVGADSSEKSELEPALMGGAKIVVDLLAQAVTMGDLHHAIDDGAVTVDDVHAELVDVIMGRKPGRTREDEIIVFDSTGTAIQDVASAVAIWKRALAGNAGSPMQFGAL
ncbi:MAG TPA: ornithine cyclodeaminase family protein [Casimicrobiaceae bacterium]